MRTTRMALVIGSALLAATSAAGAQRRSDVPPSMMPSAGMCRVWIDGISVLREPPQTDCETARRTAPANARILYGPQTGNVQNDPRRGQVSSTDPRRDTRYDQRTIAERQRLERERQQLALEQQRAQQRAQQREQLRLANQQRDQNRLRAEQQRRDEWKRTHPNASDSRDRRRDDQNKNDDNHGRGNSGNSSGSSQNVDPRRVPR